MPIQSLLDTKESMEEIKAKAKGPTPGFVSIAEQQRQLQAAEKLK